MLRASRLGILAGVVALSVGGPAAGGAQAAYVRFDLATVGDSTVKFSIGNAHWVKHSVVGLVVDPAHEDELIAKFRVVRVERDTAIAVITGQTARLTSSYVAVLSQPAVPIYKKVWFWGAFVAGGVLGFIIHR